MQTARFFAIRAGVSIAVVLAVLIPEAREASPVPARLDSHALSSTHPGFVAVPSVADGREEPAEAVIRLVRRTRDSDGDGIEDRQDDCPDTPPGAAVDPRGCPTDEDRDGVFDGADQCGATALGATVDAAGCPRDADADGVLDGLDRCADTDPRTSVNGEGCPYDTDGDGVLDGIDRCDATPMGAVVDERGCGIDTNGDGVPDGLDACPDTSPNAEVDGSGCSRLQRGELVLPTIGFGSGSKAIAPGSCPDLDEVACLLKANPDLTVEIGGHTDREGPASRNRQVSLERAEAVKAYLVSKGVPASRLVTKGYGEVHPIASNRYAEGRARNRRIEFRVLPPSAAGTRPEEEREEGGPGSPSPPPSQ
jgi:outer membrane protein OmpA-like peptidoglycan-associated protein